MITNQSSNVTELLANLTNLANQVNQTFDIVCCGLFAIALIMAIVLTVADYLYQKTTQQFWPTPQTPGDV